MSMIDITKSKSLEQLEQDYEVARVARADAWYVWATARVVADAAKNDRNAAYDEALKKLKELKDAE